jgi:hypothetical protein
MRRKYYYELFVGMDVQRVSREAFQGMGGPEPSVYLKQLACSVDVGIHTGFNTLKTKFLYNIKKIRSCLTENTLHLCYKTQAVSAV